LGIEAVKERLSGVKPYRPSPYVEQLSEKTGINPCDILKLDANENLFLSKHFMQQVMIEASHETDPRLYPEREAGYLREQIAQVNGVDPDQIVIASGGDQIIELIYNSLVGDGGKVAAITPTFSMYPRAAKQRQIEYTELPLNPDFTLNTEKNAQSYGLLILCNPNNPTGNQFDREKLIKLVDETEGFVLVDEAYNEYGEYSLASETKNRKNMLILRTFSKAYGMAGLRLGYCITNSELAEVLTTKCLMPYPVSSPVLRAGSILLRNKEQVDRMVEEAKVIREELIDNLNEIDGVTAYSSATNFVLFNTEKQYLEVYEGLKDRGMLVRAFGDVLDKKNCLRVTVAPKPMMKRFIEALKEAAK
jgi:histidinol-phosphate aminotransferase